MSLMKKRLPWFKTVLLVAMACGIAAFWFVDAWLKPGHQVFQVSELVKNKPPPGETYYFEFDGSHRWMRVLDSERSQWVVFDLDQDGRQVNRYPIKPIPGICIEDWPRFQKLRRIVHRPSHELVVYDESILDGTRVAHPLGTYREHSIVSVLVPEEGDHLVVIYHLPLMPLRMTGLQGPSLLAHALVYDYLYLADVWDITTGQRLKHFAVGAAFPHTRIATTNFLLSPNGQWLVKLETPGMAEQIKELSTPGWTVMPLKPRGVEVINTTTGKSHCLLEKPYESESFGVYHGKILGNQLLLVPSSISLDPSGGKTSIGSIKDSASRSNTLLDLSTGQATVWPWAVKQQIIFGRETLVFVPSMNAMVSYSTSVKVWPTWMTQIAELIHYDLVGTHSQLNWNLSFQDVRTKELLYQTTIAMPAQVHSWSMVRTSEKMESLVLVVETRLDGDHHIYRWKVPFTIYSPWWARVAGVLVVVLILACYGMVVRRGRQRLI